MIQQPNVYGKNGAGGLWHLPPYVVNSWEKTGIVTLADEDELKKIMEDFSRKGIIPDRQPLIMYDISRASKEGRVDRILVGLDAAVLEVTRSYARFYENMLSREPRSGDFREAYDTFKTLHAALGDFGFEFAFDGSRGKEIQKIEVSSQIEQIISSHMN